LKEQAMKKLIISMAILAMLSGCAYSTRVDMQFNNNVEAEMSELYSAIHEKSFCLGDNGIYNVLDGTLFSVVMPVCDKGDIVFHTHPMYAEPFPSFTDEDAWKKYRSLFGNKYYGILFSRTRYKIYKVQE